MTLIPLNNGNELFLKSQSNSISPLSGKSGEVFEILERRFANGGYRFGEMLSLIEIAEEFGVTQQPVRTAFAQLRAIGYVIVIPKVGCRVASPNVRDIGDFFLLLGRMEGVIAALAATRHSVEEISALDVLSAELHESVTRHPLRGIPENYAIAVDEWHRVIREMAHSETLAWRMRSFWRMSDFLLWQGAPDLQPGNLALANKQREAIRDSIVARDADTVEHLMAAHVRGKPFRVGILSASTTRDAIYNDRAAQ